MQRRTKESARSTGVCRPRGPLASTPAGRSATVAALLLAGLAAVSTPASHAAEASPAATVATLATVSGPAAAPDSTPPMLPATASSTAATRHIGPRPTATSARQRSMPDPDRFWSSVDVEPSQFPGAVQDRELRALWAAGLEAEFANRLADSSEHYIEITRRRPDSSLAYWRASRNYWRLGDAVPEARRDEKIHWFEQADLWAQRGIEIDPECAACMLFRVGALGRLATTRGITSGARTARTMAELLDRGIALQPAHTDGEDNSTLGNLYYASSNFYRTVPDWRILEWLIGVRGDKERALRDIRKAVEISNRRIDYRVELGATLLCLGSSKDDPARVAEGIEVLEAAHTLEPLLASDSRDLALARVMAREPEKACGFSRDGFVDQDDVRKAF